MYRYQNWAESGKEETECPISTYQMLYKKGKSVDGQYIVRDINFSEDLKCDIWIEIEEDSSFEEFRKVKLQ